MNELQILNASNNSLGKNEIYDEALENLGKNSDIDTLAVLEDKNNLFKIYLNSNPIKWVGYLKKLPLLKTLNLPNCLNIKDITEIKQFIDDDTVSVSIPDIYRDMLLDDNTIALNLSYAKITSSKLINYSNFTNLQYLDFRNMDIVSDTNESLSDEVKSEILNSVLSKLINTVYLNLKNITFLNDFSFLKNMTNLKGIDLNGCNAFTNRQDADGNDLGIEWLNYCEKLGAFNVSSDLIDLTLLQPAINKVGKNSFRRDEVYRFKCFSSIACATLEKCSDIEYLSINSWPCVELDLSKLTKLKEINNLECMNKSKIKLPKVSNLKLSGWHMSCTFDFSQVESFDTLILSENDFNIAQTSIQTLKEGVNINTLRLDQNIFSDTKNLNILNNLKCNVNVFRLPWEVNSGVGALTSLNGIKNLSNLKELYIGAKAYPKLYDISELSYLGDINTIDIQGCSISDISCLINLRNLQTINLKDNNLTDSITIKDELGENIKYNTLQILADLNLYNGGKLSIVDISNNSAISNFDILTVLKWNTLIY